MSDKPKLMKRRSIRKAELSDLVFRQFNEIYPHLGREYFDEYYPTKARLIQWLNETGVCDYSGGPINGQPFDFDHKIPNALLYEGDEIVWEVVLRKWHKVKTKADIKTISKARRLAGETGQYARRKRRDKPLIQGRGFQPAPEGYSAWGKPRSGNGGGFNRGYKPTVRHDD